MRTLRARALITLAGFPLAVGSPSIGVASAQERSTVEKEITLPYKAEHIVRLSDGDLVVFGSGENRPWAARLSADGNERWSLLEGEDRAWGHLTAPTGKFTGVVELPEHQLMFCGFKLVNNEIVLARAGADGKWLDDKTFKPDKNAGVNNIRCVRWGEGIALFSSLIAPPAAARAWYTWMNIWKSSGRNWVCNTLRTT